MTENGHNFVHDLALESERINELEDSIVTMSSRLEYSEIIAWNGEVLNNISPKQPSKSISEKPSRLLSRRKSDSETPSYNITQSARAKQSFLQQKLGLISPGKRLPAITQKVIIPKLHYVQAPMQRSQQYKIAPGVFYDHSLSESPVKNIDKEWSQRGIMRKTMQPIDLMKKQEILYEFSPIKPVNKNFEVSMEALRSNIRPRNFSQVLDSLE